MGQPGLEELTNSLTKDKLLEVLEKHVENLENEKYEMEQDITGIEEDKYELEQEINDTNLMINILNLLVKSLKNKIEE